MSRTNEFVKQVGVPRLIIAVFLLVLLVTAFVQGQNMATLCADVIVRFGMNLPLGLAMIPSVMSGTGMNFGLTLGILSGILGGLVSIELGFRGWLGFVMAIAFAIPISVLVGYLYGKLLNAVKGSEMVVGTYIGYSAVSFMSIGWLLMPFKDPNMVWPIAGKGLRATIALSDNYDGILNKFLSFQLFGSRVSTGLVLFGAFTCFLIWLFSRSRSGVQMNVVGANPRFAVVTGISVNNARILGTVISTMLGAVGIIVYAQSFGFYQLYQAPLNMAFAPVAAVLLGGATTSRISIFNVVLGTFLFQALLTIALPVANIIMPEGNLSEVIRITVSNGVILYALAQAGGGGDE
jgi:simple sugar transport system permease protein